jgi:hypothetical protein
MLFQLLNPELSSVLLLESDLGFEIVTQLADTGNRPSSQTVKAPNFPPCEDFPHFFNEFANIRTCRKEKQRELKFEKSFGSAELVLLIFMTEST